jgi:hypothetical protein
MDNLYGSTQSEKKLKQITACRDIVREITKFGVTNQQILFIIQLLAYELEDVEQMRELVGLTRTLMSSAGDDFSLLSDKPELIGT